MERGKTGFWVALFCGVVVAAVSPAALAQKGGHARNRGVPDVNLGIGAVQRGNAGVFVPVLPPAGSGAAGLTPSNGMPAPGHLNAPGLRLGVGRAAGSPGIPVTPGLRAPQSAARLPQPREGLAPGITHGELSLDAAHSPTAESVARPVTSGPTGSASTVLEGSESFPRRIPVCR